MQIHIGNLIREELRRQGHTNEWLAEQIGTSPRNLWRIYNKSSVDTHTLLRISIALKTNMFKPYDEAFDTMTEVVV